MILHDDDEHAADGGRGRAAAARDAAEPADSICAMCENRQYEVGLACLRLSNFSVVLTQFCDDQAYSRALSELTQHSPRQILFPPSAAESVLARVVEAEFPSARLSQVARRNWNEAKGFGYVRHYAHRSEAQVLETNVAGKYLCLSALAALVDAVEQAESTSFVKGTLHIKYAPIDGVMLLDPATVQNLELLRNLRTGDPKTSLFGTLNHCKTAAGTVLSS